jgi:hypothetical protein
VNPEPHLPSLTPALSELVDGVLGWIIEKIEAAEGFSALMVSRHHGGTRASHYHADSVEEALEQAVGELRGPLADAVAYALAYDARIRVEGGEQPVFLVRVEESGMERAHELALRYALRAGDQGVSVEPERHLQPTGRTFPAMLAG